MSEAIRKDSIANEGRLRFTASVLISEMKWDKEFYSQSIRYDWEKRLKDLGFEKQAKILKYSNCTGYGDELYDIYAIPYTRILNGRNITIEPLYAYGKREQSGDWIPEKDRRLIFIDGYEGDSFIITFSDLIDYKYFEEALDEIGMSKHFEVPGQWNNYSREVYYESDPKKYKGKRKAKRDGLMGPSVKVTKKGEMTFSIDQWIGG